MVSTPGLSAPGSPPCLGAKVEIAPDSQRTTVPAETTLLVRHPNADRRGPGVSQARTKLNKLVIQSGLRQYQIAGIVGIHQTEFSLMVREMKPIPPVVLVRLSQLFEVTPATIIGSLDDEPSDI